MEAGGRTKQNYLHVTGVLFRFAIGRRYLPKDAIEEISVVQQVKVDGGEIEIFTPLESAEILNAAALLHRNETAKKQVTPGAVRYFAVKLTNQAGAAPAPAPPMSCTREHRWLDGRESFPLMNPWGLTKPASRSRWLTSLTTSRKIRPC